jgi:hypothetical protein
MPGKAVQISSNLRIMIKRRIELVLPSQNTVETIILPIQLQQLPMGHGKQVTVTLFQLSTDFT